MFIRKIFLIILLFISVAQVGCGNVDNKAAITGIIFHNHPMDVPVGCVITIQIEDITKASASGKIIAHTVIESQGEVLPMPFDVIYNPKEIRADHTYSVKVTIEDPTRTILYSNNSIVPVITNGNPTQNIEVYVVLIKG
jgi:putative lipoprotein